MLIVIITTTIIIIIYNNNNNNNNNNKSKGNVSSNYRPITCLPLMWRLLTSVIADQTFRSKEVVTRGAGRVQERF